VQQTIAAFLERFPTPTLLLAAADEYICRTITSVGLQVRAPARPHAPQVALGTGPTCVTFRWGGVACRAGPLLSTPRRGVQELRCKALRLMSQSFLAEARLAACVVAVMLSVPGSGELP